MLRGRCACKAVAYEIPDEFVAAYMCHCSNCRALTGSAFLPAGRIEREKLTVTKGAESLLVDGDPDAAYEVRCAKCFSLLYWTSRDDYFGVAYGTLIDEPTSSRRTTSSSGRRLLGTRFMTTSLSTTSARRHDRLTRARLLSGVIPERWRTPGSNHLSSASGQNDAESRTKAAIWIGHAE